MHARRRRREKPGKTAAVNVGFEAAIPEYGTRRITSGDVRKLDRFLPDAMGVGKIVFLDEEIGERNDIGGAHTRMKENQALPDGERCGELIGRGELVNNVEVSSTIRGNDAVEDGFNVGIDAPAAGEGLGAALGVGINRAANFRKGLRAFVLAQQKISVAPGDGGRRGIRVAGLEIGITGCREVAYRFVHSAEVKPGVGVAGI